MKQTGIATLALLLALNVALGTILGAGMKAYADDTCKLYVGGKEITSGQLTVNGDTGTATYAPETHTLTLNNYSYTGDGYYDNAGQGGGIDYRGDADLLIILKGSNSITKSATSLLDYSHGIYFHGEGHTLTISGDGTLEISFAEATTPIKKKRNGIFCEPGAFVMKSGSVVTKGGYANESVGIYTQDGITINGGTFTGIGNPTTNYASRGIYTLYNGIIINGGKVTAQATDDTNAAWAFGTPVTINGGTVTAQATSNTNVARAFSGSVTINGGTVTASASSNGDAKAFSDPFETSVAIELLDMKVGDSKENATTTTNTGNVSEKKYVYIKVNESEDITPTVSITGWIYGEYSKTANAPSVTGNTGNGTVTYSYKVKDAEDSTYTSTVPTDAGDYTVQASIAAAGKYKAGSATADFTVSKADPTIKAPTTQELSYTGTAQALVTAGTTTGGTMVYALGTSTAATNDYSASIPTATDEGTYYVWYKVLGDTNYKDSAPAVVSVTVTLTRYTINYEMNGGSNSENNPSSYTMKSKDITLSSSAARNGYTFIGWTGSNGTTPSTSVTIPSGSSGNKNYTANWQKITYKISFDLNGGELGEGQTNPTNYDVESLQFSPNVPTRKGYNFEGWLNSLQRFKDSDRDDRQP